MKSLAWKLNRLRLMQGPELAWRTGRALRGQAARCGIGLAHTVPPPRLDRWGAPWLATDPPQFDRDAVLAAAERLMAGRWHVFSLDDAPLGFPPQWNRDPKTGTLAPLTLGTSIDYRDESIVGDIKYLWEPSRHLELVTLTQAWLLSRDQRYLHAARTLLQSWLDQCPYPLGVHWCSALELAIRLLNWAVAWHWLGGADSLLFEGRSGADLRNRWLDSIYRHCHFIAGGLSLHSSANNHLLGEYMGLLVASITWPCWPQSEAWRTMSLRGFEAEALTQNAADGVNREQAVYYQHEVMDMMLLMSLATRSNGITLSNAFDERLEKMAEFIAALMDSAGHVPAIGDADDAQMVRLSHEPGRCAYRSLLASCALLFQRGDFKRHARRLDDKNRWLFDDAAQGRWDALGDGDAAPARLAFPDGGYYLLGSGWGSADEVKLVIDCAPLGYLSIAAHGHADALAFTLSAGGEQLLVDPGTYAYHTEQRWRDHFRSTAAHNTVCVDGQNQSVIGGNFMWLQKAAATLIEHDAGAEVQRFCGRHDGYSRLADPVQHTRRIEYDTASSEIAVTDRIDCAGRHQIEVWWHWSPAIHVELIDGRVHARGRKVHASLTLHGESAAAFSPILLRGDEALPAGWVSPRFDDKEPAAAVVWRGCVEQATELVTRIQLRFDAPPQATSSVRARARTM